MQAPPAVATFLFTDIESSTRLWEDEPSRMPLALARHDELARVAVESNRGIVVKMVGDGVQATFGEPLDALNSAIALQHALIDADATNGIALRVRCGLHTGPAEHRDNDYFGSTLNRAARIMAAAHGGQVLLSQAVATFGGRTLARRRRAAQPGPCAPARFGQPPTCLSGTASAATAGFSAAAITGSDAEQPADGTTADSMAAAKICRRCVTSSRRTGS